MSDSWEVFERVLDEGRVAVMYDTQFQEPESRGVERVLATCVWVDFRDADVHGMGATREAAALDSILDRLEKTLNDEGNDVLVARDRGCGTFRPLFYCPERFGEVVSQRAHKYFAGWQVDIEQELDFQWKRYEHLCPTEKESWDHADVELVEILRRDGDNLAKPREVEHVAFFSRMEQAAAYIGAIQTRGFDARVDDPEAGEEFVRVRVRRQDPVELEHIRSVSSYLDETARAHGGTYDGWETPVVRGWWQRIRRAVFGGRDPIDR